MGLFERLFGGGEASETQQSEADVVVDLSDTDTNVDGAAASGVTVSEGDPSGLVSRIEDGTWFTAHDLDAGETESTAKIQSKASGTVQSRSVDDGAPDTGAQTESSPGSSAVQLPADPAVLQALEIRAKNGAQQRVETLYVLTAQSDGPVRNLWALDDPDLYEVATDERLVSYSRRVANTIAENLSTSPRQIVRVHTHPPTHDPATKPSATPSRTDLETAGDITEQFEDVLGSSEKATDFAHGIHTYTDVSTMTDPDRARRAKVVDNGISWDGEQYRHTLALYDESFRTERDVELVG